MWPFDKKPTLYDLGRQLEHDQLSRRQTEALEMAADAQRKAAEAMESTERARREYMREKLRQTSGLSAAEPTREQILSACLSYRHDFGLLSEEDRKAVEFEAVEWLRAWRKEWGGNAA